MRETRRSVLAVVLTYNAPESLARCLSAIGAQTRPPDAVLVVDNASDPPAGLPQSSLSVTLLRSEHNGGPAGGHELGLRAFLGSGLDLAWVMDDDCIPEATCLDELLAAVAGEDEDVPVFPIWVDGATGERRFRPAWCGFLMPRVVVERIGLPRVELVWWTEDTEYLEHRLRRAGIRPVRAKRAVVEHHRVRTGSSKPPWKFYYEARNTIEYRFYVQDRSWSKRRRMIRSLVVLIGQIIVNEPGKVARLRAILRGVSDGVRRRSGLRYPLSNV
jgi:rhamnopyranosyl-N-acetylglucosaminyl-diphospho-decaprenol beta-1,3/1,4-galactofuranosyltransferase